MVGAAVGGATEHLGADVAGRIRELTGAHRALHACTSVEDLLARGADLGCSVCGFERGLVLGISEGRLTATHTAPPENRASDRLRRRILGEPVSLRAGSLEAHVVRDGGCHVGHQGLPSSLAEALELGAFALSAIAADGWISAVLLLERESPEVTSADTAFVELYASILAAELERVVQRVRMRELAGEIRRFASSADALTREALEGPVTLDPTDLPPPVLQLDAAPVGESARLEDILSKAEMRIARLLAQGLSNREIADELVLSPETVKSHVARVLRKLGAKNRAEAVYRLMQAAQNGRRPR